MESERPQVSVIVPALNEAQTISSCLQAPLAEAFEVILVDGASSDNTAQLAASLGARVIQAPRGRASQMNAGAQLARGDVLLFLHADVLLPPGAIDRVALAVESGAHWGRFDVHFDTPQAAMALVAFMMNQRSRVSAIATGDQAIFVSRALWLELGGFAPIALMEDIEFCARAKRTRVRSAFLREQVQVSARRWQKRGVWRTIFSMWWLRLLYFFGASPQALHARYYQSGPAAKLRASDRR